MNTSKIKVISIFLLILYLFTTTATPIFAAISYSYDANGNMTSDGTNCYVYNDSNQLKQVKNCGNNQLIAQYYYDYQGSRMEKKQYTNGTLSQTIYNPTKDYETKKLVDNTTQNTVYYEANGQILARKNPDGSKTYYQNDHLGSTNLLTDQNGNVVENTTYYPYGEIKSGGTQSKYLYTGKEKDTETGLSYYESRYYNAHLQRFTQPDTVLPNIYDPQQLNRYTYVRNNPLKYTDPTGHNIFTNILSSISKIAHSIVSFVSSFIPKSAPPQQKKNNNNASQNTQPIPLNSMSRSPNTKGNESMLSTNGSPYSTTAQAFNVSPVFPLYYPSDVSISTNMNTASQHKYDVSWFMPIVGWGDWDYKRQTGKYGKEEAHQLQDFGNYNYGAVGKAAGFPEEFLLGAAGAWQVVTNTGGIFHGQRPVKTEGLPFIGNGNGDDPYDQFWIKEGYERN
jgi:RHS repeat-associated protein